VTPSYGNVDIKEALRRSTEASGVPYHLEDPVALAAVVSMFAGAFKRQTTKRPAAQTTGLNTSTKGQTE